MEADASICLPIGLHEELCSFTDCIIRRNLLLCKILPHIQRASRKDDAALDDVLHGGVDAQHGQCNEDDTQHEHAQHNAADLAGAADKGNTAVDGFEERRAGLESSPGWAQHH